MSANRAKARSSREPWAELFEPWLAAYKANLDTLLAVTNAALAGAERMRMAQLATDVETQTQNRLAAKELAVTKDVPGVLAAQSQLSGAYSDAYVRYWTALGEAAQQTHAEIARILAARADEIGGEMQKAFGTRTGAAPALPEQFVQMLEAARRQQEALAKAAASLANAQPGAGAARPGQRSA